MGDGYTAYFRYEEIARADKIDEDESAIRLTPGEFKRIYLGEKNREGTLKGSITTEDRCPKCKEPFQYVANLGIVCPSHLTVPKRFIVTIYYASHPRAGKNERIYCDRQGKPLDTFRRAEDVLEEVYESVKTGTFSVHNYRKNKRHDFLFAFLMREFVREKTGILDIDDRFEEEVKEGRKVKKLKKTRGTSAPSYNNDVVNYCKIHRQFWRDWDVRDITAHDTNVVYYRWLDEYYRNKDKEKGIKKGLKEDEIVYKDHSKTIQNVYLHFRVFHNWCIERGSIPPTKAIRFMKFDKPELKGMPLTEGQMYDVFQQTPETYQPIMAFLMLHGTRPGEARAIIMSQIDPDAGNILINATFSDDDRMPRRKNAESKAYTVSIHPEMFDWIAYQYDTRHSDDEPLFKRPHDGSFFTGRRLQLVWDRIRRKMDIPESVRMYDATRHSAGTALAKKGYSTGEIARALGHSRETTTLRYTGGVRPAPSQANASLTLATRREDTAEQVRERTYGDGTVEPPVLSKS